MSVFNLLTKARWLKIISNSNLYAFVKYNQILNWSSEDNASLLEGSTDNIGIGIVLCRIYLHVNNTSLFLELSSLSIQCMSISNMFIWFSFKFICDTVKKHDVIHIEETL